jgi:O-antigen/teichoic acid export membrane protein
MDLARRTAPLLAPLALGTFLNALMWMPHQSQLAHGWTSLAIKVNVIAVAGIVPAILWLVPQYGGLAAAWLWVALNAAYLVGNINFMHRRILRDEKRRWYLQDIAAPLAAAVIAASLLSVGAPAPGAHRLAWAAYLTALAVVSAVAALLFADCLRLRVATLLTHPSWRSS